MPKSSSNADQLAACTSVGVGEDECDEGRLVAILVFSSEGALYVILPYDYQAAAAAPTF